MATPSLQVSRYLRSMPFGLPYSNGRATVLWPCHCTMAVLHRNTTHRLLELSYRGFEALHVLSFLFATEGCALTVSFHPSRLLALLVGSFVQCANCGVRRGRLGVLVVDEKYIITVRQQKGARMARHNICFNVTCH
mmetsp:Transcript_41903/g.115567  ORF Transcript_41903/g.115567 Transcript_41903/m.115567 type:complete len:136 (+) Transcript_41903:2494-2901(+)